MIKGIGVDIVDIKRIEAAVGRWGRRFLEKVFTEEEIDSCYRKAEPYASLAVRFAAKEAFIKAAGALDEKTGGKIKITFRDIEIVNRASGAPEIRKTGRLAEALSASGIEDVHLSLSHEKEYGIAMVIAEGAR